jgi:hypothetical protein
MLLMEPDFYERAHKSLENSNLLTDESTEQQHPSLLGSPSSLSTVPVYYGKYMVASIIPVQNVE